MLIAAIIAKNHYIAKTKIQEALTFAIDGIELRLDCFEIIDLIETKKLRESLSIPIIFTLRKQSQGGFFKGSELKRLQLIENLLEIQPTYFDFEYDIDPKFIQKIYLKYPKVNLICSYHNFQTTPYDIDLLLSRMMRKEFVLYKISTHANSTIDALRMLSFVHKKSNEINICGLCMGDYGLPTRILSPIVGNALNYASIDETQKTAPGQVDLLSLFSVYNYNNINRSTKIYALLGNPVDLSVGHIFHNQMFKKTNRNAVYLKMKLDAGELPEFFQIAKMLPFCGFSVTMPLKEKIIPFLNKMSEDASCIKAINTIVVKNGKYIGFNTDGIGALNAIEEKTKVKDKLIIVIGAGGTAKAIIYEAIKRGAKIIVIAQVLSYAGIKAGGAVVFTK